MANVVDFTQIANLLEKDIVPAVELQIYARSILWQQFGGWSADENVAQRVNIPGISFKNNQIFVTTQNGRPTTGAITTGNNFQYGTTPTNQGSLSIATETGAFLIPKAVMNVKNEGAIVDTLQFNIQSTANAMSMDMNRQCYGDGTATLAFVDGSGTSTTTVNLKPKNTASTLYNNDIPLAVRYFTVGMLIKIGTNAATTVTGITGNNTITVTDAQTFTAGNAIIKLDGSSVTALEMTGLGAMVGTGNSYMGINGATDATWNSFVDTHGGTATTLNVPDIDAAYFNANITGKANFILMNMTEFRKYGEGLTNNLRFLAQDTLYGGWKALEYMGGAAMVVLDYDCPDDKVFILSTDKLFRAEFQSMQFEPGTLGLGDRLAQRLDYEVVADWMGNIGTFVRSSNAVLTNRVG